MSLPEKTDARIAAPGVPCADVVAKCVAPGEAFAMVGFPDDHNIRDSAICADQLAFFDRHMGHGPACVCINRLDGPTPPPFVHRGRSFGAVACERRAA